MKYPPNIECKPAYIVRSEITARRANNIANLLRWISGELK